jgi:hypothetical protein
MFALVAAGEIIKLEYLVSIWSVGSCVMFGFVRGFVRGCGLGCGLGCGCFVGWGECWFCNRCDIDDGELESVVFDGGSGEESVGYCDIEFTWCEDMVKNWFVCLVDET